MEFNRNSKTTSEDKLRFISFNNTLHDILNDYRQGEKTYTLGLNDHADWTQDELSILRRGIQLPKGRISKTNVEPGDRLLTWNGKPSHGRTTLPTSYVFGGVLGPIVLIIILIILINILQRYKPKFLPAPLRTWLWLPVPFRSLAFL
ncbi:unnamed protein product [Rotaria sordida]|uniref:Cathepsin propeptide inhibitor domain-containing protein n=1 Tax=Rotaria sordida TaxID=392033 RepID=A0A814TW35_9BILA|nr:unnamed protein product [Rotaria sordida]